jgi:hypothetical protein
LLDLLWLDVCMQYQNKMKNSLQKVSWRYSPSNFWRNWSSQLGEKFKKQKQSESYFPCYSSPEIGVDLRKQANDSCDVLYN